ncbi:SDR family NAD(P)-dependent oxidoreductase [Phreatobacter aquaticus]|uniref:SDR family NAD(P)-dependent oxidoreductase n=1 Tax=Phreatobacter aquaticus TaxID=2570229 RepID=A0A4D7QGQ2_9HYPH|nr:short-chain dehydrogenase/reductase [Phreatobacter aquaticus]QCK84634.1 SDR family NAD(P)-dependent oxidoreductase [Phreatobacter aquaticus]
MDLKLNGKRVLVTGASKGIGLACAEVFAAEGAEIVMVARDAARLEAAAAGVRAKQQGPITTIAVDLSKGPERERLWSEAGAIDILVNNAGAIPGGGLLDLSMDTWEDAWSLKVMGYIHLTKLALGAMKDRGTGIIVNVIGMAGRSPRYGYVCGATGNAALMAFTGAIGGKSQEWGVRVFGINPAATRTDRIMSLSKQRAQAAFGDESRWEEMLTDLPLGRLIEPVEIANAAAFLASPACGYVSGAILDVDGGGAFKG